MPVRVVTDSTSYIPTQTAEELGITVVSLGVVFGDEAFRELDVEDRWFYEKMAASPKIPTSSQPSPAEMRAAFEAGVLAGDPVVGVFISSDMSGTLASAELVAEELRREHPGADIRIVDSRSNSMQLGFAVIAAAKAEAVAGCEVPIITIGPVIGLHVGPGTAALVYRTRDPLRSAP